MAIDPGLRRLALGTLLAAFAGGSAPHWARDLLTEGLAGHTLFGTNVVDPAQLAELTASLRSVRPDALIAIDEEGGDVTRLAHRTGSPYPGNAALGTVDDPGLTRAVYAAIGGDLAAAGINLDLAPTVDVNTADDNPIIGTRSFGSSPMLVARHAAAAIEGLQSAGVAACAKHFPGHGATVSDSHLELPTVDATLDLLRERDLPPFAAVVAAGSQAIMSAHIRVPALTADDPGTFSRRVLIDLLRGEYGFGGAIVTDALEMKGAAATAGGIGAAAVRALTAGADLLCIGAKVDLELVESVVAEIVRAVGATARGPARGRGRAYGLDGGLGRDAPRRARPRREPGSLRRAPRGADRGFAGRARPAAGRAVGLRPFDRRGPRAVGPPAASGRHRAARCRRGRGDTGGDRRAGRRPADRGRGAAHPPPPGEPGADRAAGRRAPGGRGRDGLAVDLASGARPGVRDDARCEPGQRARGRGGAGHRALIRT
jgi:beta-glucosidase-like glycosyl hydrolase